MDLCIPFDASNKYSRRTLSKQNCDLFVFYLIGTLEEAFNVLRVLAETSGAPEGIELLQWRNSANTIMFGKPGMTEQIEKGLYPPPRKPRGSEQELE